MLLALEALGAIALLILGAVVFYLLVDYIKELIDKQRSVKQQARRPTPFRPSTPEGANKPEPSKRERKVVEIVMEEVNIGWMETYFYEAFGKVRQGPVDAYMIPDPENPPENEFIGYFETMDKAHVAIEKAYLREQKKRRNRTKSQRRYQ